MMTYRTKDNPLAITLQPMSLDIDGARIHRSAHGEFNAEQMLAAGYYRDETPSYDPATHKLGDMPLWDEVAGTVEMNIVERSQVELDAELQAWRDMAECTPRQARLMLKRAGLLNDIKQMINGMDEEAQIEWEYATSFKRTHPLLSVVAAQAGLTDQQLDTMFREAVTL